MGCFTGMDKEGRRAGARQCRCDFARNVAALSHACHHNAARSGHDVSTGLCEGVVQRAAQGRDCGTLQCDGALRGLDKKSVSVLGHKARIWLMNQGVANNQT